ncbi:hypothetical protein WOLCODRAFT_150650 [Wolfiporia cocos MD-104 SS10]|uniref:Uncharacterized protein n=1 Tax=Wolfiporia cocos (strain MD-104) TaxID=742152 RepID=A0A2H3JV50_WOLCO|nr:hypothetical protein WOLCODRAFT_150650 [Wolfiporia cocos MD-104 SS10]
MCARQDHHPGRPLLLYLRPAPISTPPSSQTGVRRASTNSQAALRRRYQTAAADETCKRPATLVLQCDSRKTAKRTGAECIVVTTPRNLLGASTLITTRRADINTVHPSRSRQLRYASLLGLLYAHSGIYPMAASALHIGSTVTDRHQTSLCSH